MGTETSSSLSWALFVFASISGLGGVGYIIWACIIQNPPATALPLGLVVLGSFSLALSLVAYFHSYCTRCCMSVFLVMAALVTLAQLALLITTFVNLDSTAYNVAGRKAPVYSTAEEAIKSDIEIGRYVFLVVVVAQFAALLVTIVLCARSPFVDDDAVVEEHQAARSAMSQIQMEGLKHSVQRSATKSPAVAAADGNFYTASRKVMASVTKKMSQKYGEFTQDPAFQPISWWQRIPGLGKFK